jgi:type I restriction enzyme R subunit
MNESEAAARKNKIDLKLKSLLLNWAIIHNDKVKDTSKLNRHAVEEFQTETGPADYALFVDGKLLGIKGQAEKQKRGAGNEKKENSYCA